MLAAEKHFERFKQDPSFVLSHICIPVTEDGAVEVEKKIWTAGVSYGRLRSWGSLDLSRLSEDDKGVLAANVQLYSQWKDTGWFVRDTM